MPSFPASVLRCRVQGTVEACWTTPGFHAGRYPALPFFTTVPFGPSYGEFFAWKIFGNGNKLRNEIYEKHGLVAFDSFAIGPETSGWFRREIKSLAELKGIKMRFFGLGARVMQKHGVQTQLLAPADIFPALERGVIDATEFSMPTMDIKQGFHQVAKFNYFPGWHQQVSVSEVLMNKKAFDALPKSWKIVEVAAGNQVLHLRRVRGDAVRRHGRDARQAQGADQALDRRADRLVREGLARGDRRGIRQDPLFKKIPTTTSSSARSTRSGARRRR